MGNAFIQAMTGGNLYALVIGSVLGMIIGAAPGLGPVFGLALFLPMTFSMTPEAAIIFMAALYASTVYGDCLASILLNTPGGPGSVATTFDGYPMTQRGDAGRALGLVTVGSFTGGFIGALTLLLLGPALAKASLLIGASEFFLVAVAGLCLVALAAKGNVMKGIQLGGLGLLLSFIGRSVVTGDRRYNFGTMYLEDGLPFVPLVIGLFAFSQVMVLALDKEPPTELATKKISGVLGGVKEILTMPVTLIRSALIGSGLGVLPALGINAASFISYVVEKSTSKNPESYGTGNPRGIVAPETANNACACASLVPTFGLGVPGSSTAAIFLSAMMIHGIQPGYAFFTEGGDRFNVIMAGIFLAQVAFLIMGLAFAPQFAKVTQIPNHIIAPIIMVLCFIGSFSYRGQVLDMVVMLVAGFAGYYLNKAKFPIACFILGMILGNLAEDNFTRALRLSRGSFSIFIDRPISQGIIAITVICFLYPIVKKKIDERKLKA